MDGADGVYPASEDTFLLIDALTHDAEFLLNRVGDGLCIEIGCGSGEVSEALASILRSNFCIFTDVNPKAVKKTQRLLAKDKKANADMALSDMFTPFKAGTKFDVIVFNPPYVPTDQEELQRAFQTRDISASWAGGTDGREVIDKFLTEFDRFLTETGVMYLVLLQANRPNEVAQNARRQGYSVKIVEMRRAGIEQLYILRFQKNCDLAEMSL